MSDIVLQRALAGRYSIIREIGRGGMGIVYLARDVALERLVAIKVLPPDLAADLDLRQRFVAEARTAAALTHPNIVPIHGVEERGALVFFVMTYIEGETLGQWVRRRGPMTGERLSGILRDVAWALAYAHARGVVHRDVKPDNILIERETGRALVTDFGIAHAANATIADPGDGNVLGTPRYMSPEQAAGLAVDGRADLYSLGMTAYVAITGAAPSPAQAGASVMVDAALASVVEQCLEPDPARRPASADQVALALSPAVARETPVAIRHLFNAVRTLDPAVTAVPLTMMIMQNGGGVATFGPVGNPYLGLLLLLGAPLVVMLFVILPAMVQAVRAGYGPEDVRRALVQLEQAAAEEHAFAGGKKNASERSRARRGWLAWCVGTAAAVAGAVITAGAVRSGHVPSVVWTQAILLLGLGGGAHVVSLALNSPEVMANEARLKLPGMKSVGIRFLRSTAGSGMLSGLSRLLMRSDDHQLAYVERTALTEQHVVRQARASFDRLPAGTRARFTSVPQLLDQLAAEAEQLRARGNADERLARVVAVMEHLRLDVARLAGDKTLEADLTDTVARAIAVKREVDIEIAARREVRTLLET